MHEVDTFTTLLRFVSADMSDDRPIDGVDQRGLFPGESEYSVREGFPIYFGDKLYAAKWRNFKLHLVWQVNATRSRPTDGHTGRVQLADNPRENPHENLATTHVWLITGASKN